MPAVESARSFIEGKIQALKEMYPSLRRATDNYVFSALAIKAHLYKNPALVLNENDFDTYIVDGQYDGGVDFLLSDPNSESSDLIIGQSKYYQTITTDDVRDAVLKMALFFKDMKNGHYERVNEKVQGSFLSLYSEVGEESKVRFVFCTSAPKGRISKSRIENIIKEQFSNSEEVELVLLFGDDLVEEIKESESRRPTVESGKIVIDKAGNCLAYSEDAVIVNASAFSIKKLYAQHSTNLLARNLRYHVTGTNVDRGIKDTIMNSPETFWMKNNGLTIICDSFVLDGRIVRLTNFSIINGGQTTYMLHKSKLISQERDVFLPCKIIQTQGATEDEKNLFSLEIAKAANSQKAIKKIDLKANSPEQVRFGQTMREVGIFYQTKRGETVPKVYKAAYLNTDLADVGKLALAGIFQMPGACRNKPSTLYQPQYYDFIFNGNQMQVARICKELLYINFYFKDIFQKRFDAENRGQPDDKEMIAFAHNARTICIAFAAFAARYKQGNIGPEQVQVICDASRKEIAEPQLYETVRNLVNVDGLFSSVFNDKDKYDELLYKLFMLIISYGFSSYMMAAEHEEGLNASNYLKKDRNYYSILRGNWMRIRRELEAILNDMA